MREKQNDLFTIGVIAAILLVFATASLLVQTGLLPARYGDEAAAPRFRLDRLMSGEFAREYEDYIKESFRSHEKWERLWTDFELLLGKRDLNGVYIGKQDTYFEQHLAVDYTEKMEQGSLEYLAKLADGLGARVMLVPSSDAIWEDRLFSYAGFWDQKAYLDRAREAVGEENWVDLYDVLQRHADEEIYFRTDPRWTALGAYYGYYAWWQGAGKYFSYYYNKDRMTMVTGRFAGNLQKRAGREVRPEALKVFSETLRSQPAVQKDGGIWQPGYYRRQALDGEDPYEYFLGEEAGMTVIRTGCDRNRSLLVIGDSYANGMLPLLALHYETIYLLNPRLSDMEPQEALETYDRDGKLEVLVLHGVPGLLELFRE